MSEQVPADDPRSGLISIDPERLGGEPCFAGTRLPVKSLFDHLANGVSLDEFLDDFEGVSREACLSVLKMSCERMLIGLPSQVSPPL